MTDRPFRRAQRLPPDAYDRPDSLFHLVARALPETAPFRGQFGNEAWALVLAERDAERVRLAAACLMPDHLHLLAARKSDSITTWVGGLKSVIARRGWKHGMRGRVWQPGFFDRRIRDGDEYERTLAYVRSNPIAAGMLEDEADWPWIWFWTPEATE